MQNASCVKDIINGYFMNDGQSSTLDMRESIYVISDNEAGRVKYRDIIEIAGHRVTGMVSLAESGTGLETQVNLSAVCAEITAASDIWPVQLHGIEMLCKHRHIPLLLLVPISLVDEVMDQIDYSNVEYIITADETASHQTDISAEIIVSLPRRIARTKSDIYEGRDEIDTRDLKKISADVERIARALNQLSSQDSDLIGYAAPKNLFQEPEGSASPEGGARVADVPVHFAAQEKAGLKPMGYQDSDNITQELPKTETRPITARQVRNVIKARRLREQYFDAELFADPAWDMLLDLMAAQLENRRVSVSSLCIAASVPPTTALRWIKTMTEEKIFQRKADTQDGRRIFIELSDQTTAAMIGFFGMIRRTGGILV